MTIDQWNDDAAYWGLTPAEKSRWLSRLSAYHVRRSRFHADKAIRFSRQALRLLLIWIIAQAVAVVLPILAMIIKLT